MTDEGERRMKCVLGSTVDHLQTCLSRTDAEILPWGGGGGGGVMETCLRW